MRKETIVCDYCGKEIEDGCLTATLEFDCGATSVYYDMHRDCAEKVKKTLADLFPNGGTSKFPF